MIKHKNVKSYYIENTKFSRIAFAQVYEIVTNYGKEARNIPEKVIRFLEDNRDKEYVFDYEKNNIKLEKDAENLLIYIYIKYLATEKERVVLENMAKLQYEQKVKQEMYKVDTFAKKEEDNQIEDIKFVNDTKFGYDIDKMTKKEEILLKELELSQPKGVKAFFIKMLNKIRGIK